MTKSHHDQRGNARTQVPERRQIEFRELSLDQWLDSSHRVRDIWAYVQSLDLSDLYKPIKATRTNVGRSPIDPQIIFALWLFATLEGITSGRRIAELTTRDIAYMWICGSVSVNYHSVCDFRTDHGDLLERILTDSIGVLMHEGLVTLDTIAQDGMRVRASAGSSSFRRQESLEASLEEAIQYMKHLEEQDGDGGDRRQQAAKQRAAREKQERLEAACLEMEDIQSRYKKRTSSKKRSEPRASTSDPEARRMKMGDNGFRPAMNVEFASDGDTLMVVSVDVTSQGSDSGLMKPMYDDVCQTYDATPERYLVDGVFSKKEDIEHLENSGTQVYAPLYAEQKQIDAGKDPYASRPKEGPGVTAHRKRMGTPEAKEIYRDRFKIAEFPNADCRNRGLTQFRVRGLAKAKAQTLWHVLIFNYLRMKNLVCLRREISYLEIVMAR